jgi:hypothetical protein
MQFVTDRWDHDFANLSPKHILLMIFMESKANPAGIFTWDQSAVEGHLKDRYNYSDVDALGHRAIWLDRECVLIPSFLRVQYGKLSRACPAHKRVFAALESRWGKKGDLTVDPFIEAWTELGIDDHIPPIDDERIAGHVPAWYCALKSRADKAQHTPIPKAFPEQIQEDVAEFFAYRHRKAIQASSKDHGDKWDWSPDQARITIATVKDFLKRHTERSVHNAIQTAMGNNARTIFEPKNRFAQ